MIFKMTLELGKFLVFWFVMIVIFSCVAMLVFSHSKTFHDLQTSFVFFLQAALGSYDFSIFKVTPNDTGDQEAMENAKRISEWGVIYMVVYLFVNMILMLNMIIAILAEVFSKFTDQKVGLYQSILLEMMPSMEFDSKYGVIV
jgi:hypothetical protein